MPNGAPGLIGVVSPSFLEREGQSGADINRGVSVDRRMAKRGIETEIVLDLPDRAVAYHRRCMNREYPAAYTVGQVPETFRRDGGVIATRLHTNPIFVSILPADSIHFCTKIRATGGAFG
ncbi:MAG: hypothetical protein ACLQDM_00845 [Bradyrhizobium sp.]